MDAPCGLRARCGAGACHIGCGFVFSLLMRPERPLALMDCPPPRIPNFDCALERCMPLHRVSSGRRSDWRSITSFALAFLRRLLPPTSCSYAA